MVRKAFAVGVLAAGIGAGMSGCVSTQSHTPLVQPNAFGTTSAPPPRTMVTASPASVADAARVDSLGRKILADNPEIGAKVLFSTIGAPQPEIFHRGTAEIIVTAGLVTQCQADERLAAVLCNELAKMVTEREQLTSPDVRSPQRRPTIDVPVGNDYGAAGGADLTRLAELEKYSPKRKREAVPLPDPNRLARTYLRNAGFQEGNLDAVAPLLQEAERHTGFEKQMTATPAWGR